MNQEKPLISVIVPVYNVEKYLRQCLDSVLSQTYKNIEVIMVDDGSPDGCGMICEEYASKYANFKVIHKENAGLGMARNTGLEHVTGEYVMFLDSDDYIDKNLIEILYKNIYEKKVDVCKSGFRRVNDDWLMSSEIKYNDEFFPGIRAKTEFLPRLIGSAPNKKDSFEMSVWASLYKVEHIKNHNIRFPSERDLISEDLVFNIEYMQYANGACAISDIGYNYRININSLTKSYRPDRFAACIKFYNYVKPRLENLGYGVETIYRLDRMLFVYTRSSIKMEWYAAPIGKKRTAKTNIKKICCDSRLQEMVSDYPIEKLGFKQKMFLYMIKYKLYKLLCFCAAIKLI